MLVETLSLLGPDNALPRTDILTNAASSTEFYPHGS